MDILTKYNQYLKGNLSEQETESFTKTILKEYFEDEDLKVKWKEILKKEYSFSLEEKTIQLKKSKSIVSKKVFLRIATLLSTAACIFLVFYLFQTTEETKPSLVDKLLSEHIDIPITRSIRKGESEQSELRKKAYRLYNNKKYKASIPIFKSIIKKGNETEDDHFFLGLSYLYQKETVLAIEHFDWILNQKNIQREDSVTWYLGLALVASGDYERSKIYLNKVAVWDNNSGRLRLANSAKELLKDIENQDHSQ